MKTLKEEYPELFNLASEIARETLKKINDKASRVKSDCKYKCQCTLEMVISELEKSV